MDIIKYEIIDNSQDDPQRLHFAENDDREEAADDNDETNDDNNDPNNNDNNERSTSRQLTKKFKSTLAHTTDAFLYFTDQMIAYGLAIPRSVSVSTEAQENARPQKNRHHGKKDVFVYSKKEVVCDSDNEQTHSGTSSRSMDMSLGFRDTPDDNEIP
jgi:hypothetical protein